MDPTIMPTAAAGDPSWTDTGGFVLALISLLLAIVGSTVGWVQIKRAKADALTAKRQAKAARELADEAKKQTAVAQRSAATAEEHSRTAQDQLEQMRHQTSATLASISPHFEFVYVALSIPMKFNDGRLAQTRRKGHEWRLYNHGGAAAIDVELILAWDPQGVQYGQLELHTIPKDEQRPVKSTRTKLGDIAHARELLESETPFGAIVKYRTIAGVPGEVFVPVVERYERE
jgi:hypothetical protein